MVRSFLDGEFESHSTKRVCAEFDIRSRPVQAADLGLTHHNNAKNLVNVNMIAVAKRRAPR